MFMNVVNLDLTNMSTMGRNVKWFQRLDNLGHYTLYVENQRNTAYRLLKFSIYTGKQEFYVISRKLGKCPVIDQIGIGGDQYVVLQKERMHILNMKDKHFQSILLD